MKLNQCERTIIIIERLTFLKNASSKQALKTNNTFTKQYILHIFPETKACDSDPCLNGATCFEAYHDVSYHCNCSHGFTGINCEIGEYKNTLPVSKLTKACKKQKQNKTKRNKQTNKQKNMNKTRAVRFSALAIRI